MEESGCPRCKTTKYRNPSLKLMVNVCGHTLCENCVQLLFVQGSGECQQCHIPLRRNNFRLQMFDDSVVEKDVDIRKKILRDFNKKEGDFTSLREYNDYLELVETLIFNLCNDIDVESTRERIERYKEENQQQIKKNRSKLSRDEEFIEMLIEQEQEEQEINRRLLLQEQQQLKQRKQKQTDELIDDLMFSDLPADHIIQSHHMRDVTSTLPPLSVTTSSLPSVSGTASTLQRPRINIYDSLNTTANQREAFSSVAMTAIVDEPFVYTPLQVNYQGPRPPGIDDLAKLRYLSHIRAASEQEKGGGFVAHIPCRRALQDAFSGLYFAPSSAS